MIEEKAPRTAHNLILENRRSLSVSGVKDVESFDERQINVFTEMGLLTIKGEDLHINSLNLDAGELSVSGVVDELGYSAEEKRTASGVLSKLFR